MAISPYPHNASAHEAAAALLTESVNAGIVRKTAE